MSKQFKIKPLAAAVGATLVTSVAAMSSANADTSPFSMTQLPSGYMVAGTGEGSCGEGSCGGDSGDKKGEGSCGEGSCGGDSGDKKGEGSCGEGSCGGDAGDKEGEGSCGGDKGAEGSCGGDKEGEGSCGGDKSAEGSCGGDKAAATATEEVADAGKSGSGSTGALTLLGLFSAIGLRRRIKRS